MINSRSETSGHLYDIDETRIRFLNGTIAHSMKIIFQEENALMTLSLLLTLNALARGGGRVVRWCWVNFQCRGVLQFGFQ